MEKILVTYDSTEKNFIIFRSPVVELRLPGTSIKIKRLSKKKENVVALCSPTGLGKAKGSMFHGKEIK